MKISYKRIDAFEFIRRIQKYVGIRFGRLQKPVFVRRALQRPHGRSAYGDNAPSFFFRAVYYLRRLLAYLKVFFMHMVLFHVFFLYGSERSESHVQQNFRDLNAFILYFVQKIFSKVKPCCRRRRRPVHFCVDGLIAIFIL